MATTVIPLDRLGPEPLGGPGSIDPSQTDGDDYAKVDWEPDTKKADKKAAELLPPEIDISTEEELRLALYLDSEVNKCRSERWEQMEKFARLRLKIRTKFPEFPKDWPIANSSQMTVPIIKLTGDTLTSRVFQTVMAADPLAAVRTKNKAFDPFVAAYEEFLGLYATEKLDMEDILDTVVTETINLGTGVVEVTNHLDKRMVVTYDALTKKYKKSSRTIFNGPKAFHFPIEDFWCRPGYQNIQTAPWCGKELRLTWSQLKDMAFAGEVHPDKLKKMWRRPMNPGDKSEGQKIEDKLDLVEPLDWEEFRIFELSARWDADGDGLDEEIMVLFHQETRTLLRMKFNTFKNGRRPWILFRYKRLPHRLYGEGVAELLEQLQDEISAMHNQRMDNATLANLQIILVSRLIRGLSPGDRLWTGKIVKVQDVQKDVNTLRLGESYRSTLDAENVSRGYARELSGAGETATGQAQPVSRTTATAQLSLLEELNRRFDKIVKGMRKSIREVFVHCSDIFAEFGTAGLAEEWLGDKGDIVEQGLANPETFKSGNATIAINSTKSTVNREVEFQSAIAVMNLIVSLGEQLLALCQQLAPQAAGMVAHELVQAIKGPFRKVMLYSDSGNVDEALSVLAVLERVLPAPEDLGGYGAAQAGENAATAGAGGAGGTATSPVAGQPVANQQPPELAGMAALLSAAGRSNGANAGVGR